MLHHCVWHWSPLYKCIPTLNLSIHHLKELYVRIQMSKSVRLDIKQTLPCSSRVQSLCNVQMIPCPTQAIGRVGDIDDVVRTVAALYSFLLACIFSFIDIVDTSKYMQNWYWRKNIHQNGWDLLLLHHLPRRHPLPTPNGIFPVGENLLCAFDMRERETDLILRTLSLVSMKKWLHLTPTSHLTPADFPKDARQVYLYNSINKKSKVWHWTTPFSVAN